MSKVFSTELCANWGLLNEQTEIFQIDHKLVKNSIPWETDQVVVTKRRGVESGITKHKSIQWQREGFEHGTSWQQIQRPIHYSTLPPHGLVDNLVMLTWRFYASQVNVSQIIVY